MIKTSHAGFPVTSAQRNSIPVFGVGLFEADQRRGDHRQLADPEDADGDGISGRFNTDFGGSIGRFGVKAQSNNIELFTRAPLQNQMGITTDPFLGSSGGVVSASYAAAAQASTNPNDPTTDNDGVPDPELGREDLGDLIAFTRFLAPPAKKPFNAEAKRGEIVVRRSSAARSATFPPCPPHADRSRPTPTCCCTTWDRGWPTDSNFGSPQVDAQLAASTPATSSAPSPCGAFRTCRPRTSTTGGRRPSNEAILLHGGEAQQIRERLRACCAQNGQETT